MYLLKEFSMYKVMRRVNHKEWMLTGTKIEFRYLNFVCSIDKFSLILSFHFALMEFVAKNFAI